MAAILRSPAPSDGREVALLSATDGPLVFFPVRHHSPAAARLVREFIRARRPRAVLIEGPSDFNDRLGELHLPHRLPIAIYTFARGAGGRRRGAFYPFCEYSPEWQAVQAAHAEGIPARFIDLPWQAMAAADVPSHRYADPQLQRSKYVQMLCRKLGVDDFDTAWDTLFEIDPALSLADYLHRCHEFCLRSRQLETAPRPLDVAREEFMAEQIRRVWEDRTSGGAERPVLVVTGGYHSSALWARLNEVDFPGVYEKGGTPAADGIPPEHMFAGQEESEEEDPHAHGLALTPYSYSRLDNLTGYESGMPNPGFYDRLWRDLQKSKATASHRHVLADVAEVLRRRKQTVSTADLIAVESTATALATIRGHVQVWRSDLIDAVLAALVKEEQAYGCTHPFLEALHEVLRGDAQGLLAAGAAVPPLVTEVKQALHDWKLTPGTARNEPELELTGGRDLPQSRLLHRLRILDITGFELTGGTDLTTRSDLSRIWERWKIQWSPDFEASLIEASRYGAGLLEAVLGRLEERASSPETSAEDAALIVLDAALAGIDTLSPDLLKSLYLKIEQDGNFISVAPALGHLLYLYVYDELFRTSGRDDLAELLSVTFARAAWLLESLAFSPNNPEHLLGAIGDLCDVFDRCQPLLTFDQNSFIELLRRVADDESQLPLVRGAVQGAQWTLGAADNQAAEQQLRKFAQPTDVGDFLTGLFALARDVATRNWEFLQTIDALLGSYSDGEFLEALPPLRLAFTYFTPREKYHLAMTLIDRLKRQAGSGVTLPTVAMAVPAEVAAEAYRLESELFETIRRFGLRGLEPRDSQTRGDSDA